ncbi:MAG: two-component system copper resistance phosphate regulon response regulator CusR, partial [Planctomycetota bacterium]
MSTALRIFLVDDDAKLRATITQGLGESGHTCTSAGAGDEGLQHLLDSPGAYDAVLLDVMMPGLNGWEVLEQLRKAGDDTPVIFLTARDAIDERVKGLELGADDYLPKPFAFAELLARLNAVVRNRRSLPTLTLGDLKLDLARRSLTRSNRRVEISPQEFELLVALVQEPDRVFSRAELLKRVWSLDFDPGTNVVQVQVARLRRKLDNGGPSI